MSHHSEKVKKKLQMPFTLIQNVRIDYHVQLFDVVFNITLFIYLYLFLFCLVNICIAIGFSLLFIYFIYLLVDILKR